MVRDADLPGEDHTAPDPARARDADLGDDDRVLADLDVVRDLHEVVDLGAAPHDRVAEHRAIDRRVGADLHVVLDEDPAHLRDLAVRLPVECVAEAVGPDHRARMDDDPPAELDAGAEHHARVEHRVLADLGARPDERERVHAHAGAQDRARLDHGQRADRGGRVDPRVRRDHRGGIDAGRRGRRRVEEREQPDERLPGLRRPQQRRRKAAGVVARQKRAGARGRRGRGVTGVDQEGDVLGTGSVEGLHAGDDPGRIALQRRLEGLGELTEGEPGSVAHRRRYFLPLFTACWSYALMISSVRSASGAA